MDSHISCSGSVIKGSISLSTLKKNNQTKLAKSRILNTLIVILGLCGYSSLKLHRNLTTGSFINVFCKVHSEVLSMNFHTLLR